MKEKLTLSLNDRSVEIFSHIVEAFVETGAPIGSKTLSQRLGMNLSPATIRNVMFRLEEAGLLYAPHTSAGRLPTEIGLRFFVEAVLEVGQLETPTQNMIEEQCRTQNLSKEQLLQTVSMSLSGLTQCAGLVIAPKSDATLKHIEFVALDQEQALVVFVTNDGSVENRIVKLPLGLPSSALVEAMNYMNSHFVGLTLREAHQKLVDDLSTLKRELSDASANMVKEGLAKWGGTEEDAVLIVHGQSKLLESVTELDDLIRIKQIFNMLEQKEGLVNILDAVIDGDGVQIFIGSQNDLFQLSGCSLVIAPFKNVSGQVIGSLGVIGPSRINYRRIIPLVDYTARLLSKVIK